MTKNFPLAIKSLELISKYSIYSLVFLLPILFLPWSSDALDFNKQFVLVLFSFIALSAWIVKVLISGKLKFNTNKTYIAVVALFLSYFLSTIFSLDKNASFWGWPRVSSESLLTIICLAIVYFLVSTVFSEKEIIKSAIILSVSAFLAVLVGILQLFGIFLLPIVEFTKNTSFNTIGLVGSLALFAVIINPIFFALIISVKKYFKIFFGVALFLNFILLLLINYQLAWWGVLLSSVLLILLGILKKDSFDIKWLSIPTFLLVLSVFFILLKPQFPVPTRALEVSLNQQASFNIAKDTLMEIPVLGSGPGTFVYDFSKYKNVSLNEGGLSNIRFDSAGSKVFNVLATVGVVGGISFLALIIFAIFYGAKFIISKTSSQDKKTNNYSWLFIGSIFIAFLLEVFAYLLHSSNISLDFVFIFLISSLIGLIVKERKEYTLLPSSLVTLGITFLFTLFIILGLGILILNGQRYYAEVNYYLGERALMAENLDEGIKKIEIAVSKNPKMDIYLTELSQVYLSKAISLSNKNNLSDEEKNDIQILINNSINSAKLATDISPNNVENWSVRGFIYQNLIGTIVGAEDWAMTSYEKAIILEPTNPYYPTQEGIVLMRKASFLSIDELKHKNEILTQAKEKLDLAIKLKSDYSLARFQIAMLYQLEGKIIEEISALEEAIKISPEDTGLLFQTGIVYYQQGNFQKAKLNLEKAVELNPNYANALYYLGLVYDKLKQDDKAIEAISKVLELNPNSEYLKKILSNLQAGKNPLDGITQPQPQQLPVQENAQGETKE